MKHIFILIVVFSCITVFRDVQADENPNLDNMSFALDQLEDAFQEMEKDYNQRIRTLEEEVKRSQDVYIREFAIEDEKIRNLEEMVKRSQDVYVREHEIEQIRPFYGSLGSLLNPDISIIGDMFYHFSDQSKGVGEFTDNDLIFREIELAILGYIYPGVRAEVYPVWEMTEGKVEIEEAFANFLTLPFNTSLLVGRQRVRFGLVNPIHQHFRNYVDVPLPVQNFLGAEGYIDEGFDLSVMLPTFFGPITLGFGAFDGDKSLAEEEEEDEGNATSAIFESTPVDWRDHVFLAKINANIFFSDYFDISLGYHVLWDDNGGGPTAIHNGQFSLRYRIPNTYQMLRWQNEIYVADIDERNVKSKGFYSFLEYDFNRFLTAGVRYDWSELGNDDDQRVWAINTMFTWRLTEATYFRAQYRYAELEGLLSANEVMLQFVWGMGPHAHALAN